MAKFEIKDGVAIIPEGTTEIGYAAFKNCTSLKSVTIPESVTEIGGCAFEDCTSFKSITISESVTEIWVMPTNALMHFHGTLVRFIACLRKKVQGRITKKMVNIYQLN